MDDPGSVRRVLQVRIRAEPVGPDRFLLSLPGISTGVAPSRVSSSSICPGRSKADWFLCPQAEYLYDKDNKLLVDFVGRFESLAQDFASACQHMGMSDANCRMSTIRRGAPGVMRWITRPFLAVSGHVRHAQQANRRQSVRSRCQRHSSTVSDADSQRPVALRLLHRAPAWGALGVSYGSDRFLLMAWLPVRGASSLRLRLASENCFAKGRRCPFPRGKCVCSTRRRSIWRVRFLGWGASIVHCRHCVARRLSDRANVPRTSTPSSNPLRQSRRIVALAR